MRRRDLLIGGTERDLLIGLIGEDILIGGATAYDDDQADLFLILAEWTSDDLYAGRALSANFTGEGWRTQLGYADAPLYSPREAGAS